MSLRGLSSTQKGRVGLRGQVWADGDLTASLFFFLARVLVLDKGTVAEFDSPTNLIAARGIFYGMARDAGLA